MRTHENSAGNYLMPSGDNYSFTLAILSALIFVCIGLNVLFNGHPHEDAYILYIYSENLSETGVISYYKGGEPAEGATDFLWMILIAAFNLSGINAAIAALALNAFGVFLMTYLVLSTGRQYGSSIIVSGFLALLIPFYVTSQAAYAGFSVALYSSLVASLFLLSVIATGVQVTLVPIVGLLLAIFRPDGAIIGALTSLILIAFLKRGELKFYLISMATCAAIGIAYFLWRWDYFGQALPLPLIVKSQADSFFAGLRPNLEWADQNILFITLSISSIFALQRGRIRALAMSLPVLAYLASLTFAFQSQNVAMRFQAPASAILLIGSAVTLFLLYEQNRDSKRVRQLVIFSLLAVLLIHQTARNVYTTSSLVRNLTSSHYINYFPYHLAVNTPSQIKIALTEAGRFAYWLPGAKYDLVGLNTATTAIYGVSPQYINEVSPDLIFFHHAGTMGVFSCPDLRNFCYVSAHEFLQILDEENTLSFQSSNNRVMRAPAAASAYLAEHINDFSIFFVRYRGSYTHVYALRNGGPIELDAFLSSLEISFSSRGQLSYWDMTRQ